MKVEMSKREQYAALAMQGMVSHPDAVQAMDIAAKQLGLSTATMTARTAFEIADAMLAESNRTSEVE